MASVLHRMDLNKRYENLLRPSEQLIRDVASLDGDIIILGAGGKMGPALARLAREAADRAGARKDIIAVARFSAPGLRDALGSKGIKTVSANLLEDEELQSLPEVKNVLYLAGMKFGTTGNEPLTWATNAYLAGRVAEKYRNSRIVAFSTGNVYPVYAVASGGPAERDAAAPVGEYAQSCLGRERLFQYFSLKYNTPSLICRLNYANDVSYGVLVDIAAAVKEARPVDLRMGYVNVIWQGDANEMAIRALRHCVVPSAVLNIAGAEVVSVRWLAEQFGARMGRKPQFVNEESGTALLSNAAESRRLFGEPKVTLHQMVEIIGDWIAAGGEVLNKPTHFQERDGKF